MASSIPEQLGAVTLSVRAKFADKLALDEDGTSLTDPECHSLDSSQVGGREGDLPCSGSTPEEDDLEDEDTTTIVFGYEDPERNLLKNWSFEEPISDEDWRIENASASRSQDSHTGDWSLYVHSRTHKHGHAYQRVSGLKRKRSYYYSCHLKFITHPDDKMYFIVRLFLYIKLRNNGRPQKAKIGRMTFQRAPTEWLQFGADFRTPDEPIEWIEPRLELDDECVDYLLDTASLIELPPERHWKQKADKLIEKHRTSTVNMSINLPRDVNPKEFTIKIRQVKRDFGFGGGIVADIFNGDGDLSEKYRHCFFEHFEWAVFINDTKWKPTEKKKGRFRFDRVDRALERLHSKGITVRAHTIHWNRLESCPDWVHQLEGEELETAIESRVQNVVEHFKGRFVQWDVCNEHLHNHFFEERTGKYDILQRICKLAHQIDPECHLYLNDYQLVRTGDLTSAQANLARELLSEGVPIHGIGVQSHLRNVPIPIEILKKRVQIVCSVGLPVMVTEFSIHTDDVTQRAQSLKEALYVYFSNPQVAGVVFWHFSDQDGVTMGNDMPLFEGPDFVPNEAGKTFISLLKRWRTNKTIKPAEHQSRDTFRAFHGQYELEVVRKGSRVWGQSFRVQKGKTLDLDIDIELTNPCEVRGGGGRVSQEQREAEKPSSQNDDVTRTCAQQVVTPEGPPSVLDESPM